MQQKKIDRLIAIMRQPHVCADNAQVKNEFHRLAKQYLRSLAEALGCETGSYNVRSNRAGTGVSGEVVLHHDKFYLQVSCDVAHIGVMYRTCDGLTDYRGGANQWLGLDTFNDSEQVTDALRRLLARTAA